MLMTIKKYTKKATNEEELVTFQDIVDDANFGNNFGSGRRDVMTNGVSS